ncbi:hypothetical protein ADL22_16500 [Streptomyces sp. NRRL F-4489]|uniref:hypothetical protein n=1 Tax=Streptomyces sp. NRRL F-4489 TaxID=1609095 RepID=UPI000749C35A|nr:hypothetical protein [Streptomyces sp. NRRL F-4489]KUL38854.1 hypothetical protein ADL22_16500 [Streptomyces sp. NRRL F-4489]
MIAVVGHSDLTAPTLKLLQDDVRETLRRIAPPGATVVVRAGRGLPLAVGRAARRSGVPMVAVLPAQESEPALLPEADRAAAGELLYLSAHVRLMAYDPADPVECVAADERLIASCATLLAVWDGSPDGERDAMAHLVRYARLQGVTTEVLWSPEYAREGTPTRSP